MATPFLAHQTLFCLWTLVISIAICPASAIGKGMQNDQFLARSGDLLQQLENAIGLDHRIATERRVSRLEEAMRPTFNALPKDKSGRLDGTGVRYMLRRLFVQRHGWFVNGLETNGDAWNSSSPTDMVAHAAGADAQGVFDKHLNTHGFDLHHAAILAATLENFVHSESVERLQVAYDLVGLPRDDDSNSSEILVQNAIKTYTLMYVLHKNHSNTSRGWVIGAASLVRDIFHNWDQTVDFLDEIRQSIIEDSREQGIAVSPISWDTTLKVVETFGERYGRWQNRDCVEMKRKLVAMEVPNTGRVPLHRFYEHALSDPEWLFKESLESLTLMGMVDESDPSNPGVIIPNYMNGPNNCAAGGKFYYVCCIDECEGLVGHLEERLVAHEARPEQIAELVANLPSDTVTAPRTLSDVLLQRLQDIADHHGGLVPLHGRLFAQWMHHAYPRECSYPHVSGTTTYITSSEMMAREEGITPEQHARLVNYGKEISTREIVDQRALPWTFEEELFVCTPGQDGVQDKSRGRFVVKTFLMLAFSGVLLFTRLRSMVTGKPMAACVDVHHHKYYV